MPASSKPQIAIVGAGPGGLLLARYLQLNSIPCKVYERETSRHHRSQGGSLDLHEESGLLAMQKAELMDEFSKFARTEGEQMKIFDKTGKLWYDDSENEAGVCHGRPEIDRIDLRNILIDSLEPDTIQWSYHLISVEPVDESSQGYTLNFSGAPSEHADILIGADGAWSRIRPLLTPAVPIYSTITFIELAISDVEIRFPHLTALIGQGLAFIVSDEKGLIPQRNSNGVVKIYVAFRVPENWVEDHPLPSDPVEARQFLISLFQDWSPSVLDLVKSTDDSPMITRQIFALPPSLTWETTLSGITLIGDAAHVMSPFAGEGVNLALLDAYALGEELVHSLTKDTAKQESMAEVNKGLRRFEQDMFTRAKREGESSASNLDAIFAKEAPSDFVEVVKSFGPPPDNE